MIPRNNFIFIFRNIFIVVLWNDFVFVRNCFHCSKTFYCQRLDARLTWFTYRYAKHPTVLRWYGPALMPIKPNTTHLTYCIGCIVTPTVLIPYQWTTTNPSGYSVKYIACAGRSWLKILKRVFLTSLAMLLGERCLQGIASAILDIKSL